MTVHGEQSISAYGPASLAIDAIDRIPRYRETGSGVREALINEQIACKNHAYEFGVDRQDATDWKWLS